ncbi:transposable element Tcb1 transposase [Trichonephila clavipes]|nr:transposable element Tcb1 transposase [Trichonephila clavipes]
MPLRRNRRQYEQLTDFDRGGIIGLREAGWSNRRIGHHLGRSDMVVARCWQQWQKVECTVAEVPSRETIRRRLTEVGLRSRRRPLRRLPLTPHHRQCRLDFCRPRATWSVTDWRRVIFSDESRFSLSADDHRTCLEAHRPAVRSAIYCRAAYSNFQGVTVWGAISWDTRSSLVVLQGTLTARRYVDDILTPIVLSMLSSRPGAIYQQDNARPHTARLFQQCLQGYDVLPWPAPDLSPIEHVWTLGRQLQPSRDTGELTAQMQRLWQDLPQGVISDLIESMPRRISACIAARGGFTTY